MLSTKIRALRQISMKEAKKGVTGYSWQSLYSAGRDSQDQSVGIRDDAMQGYLETTKSTCHARGGSKRE